jgi:hypothetical protein
VRGEATQRQEKNLVTSFELFHDASIAADPVMLVMLA